jgi:transposase
VTRGGLVHAVPRAARQTQLTYEALCATVHGSPVVTPDETAWKVGGHPYWLWAFATRDTTVYAIEDGRGFAQAARTLGADYAGVLQRAGHVSDQGLAVARGHYVNRLGRLLDPRPSRLADARRFATHLRTEFEAVFSFLFDPTLDATNWRAEHALRPAVITRKTCAGGNPTTRGAQTQQVLTSLLRTAQQRGLDTTAVLVTALQAPKPVVLDAFQSAPVH